MSESGAKPIPFSLADVERFYVIYDQEGGKPSPEALQRNYLDKGGRALRDFIPARIISAQALSDEIKAEPTVYENARRCADELDGVGERTQGVLGRFKSIYPPLRVMPVTIVIGRNNSGGTVTDRGVIIGLERACSANHLQPDFHDRMVHLIAHEYVHSQQPPSTSGGKPTLLRKALEEGVAEFVAELTSGEASESYIAQPAGKHPPYANLWSKGRQQTYTLGYTMV